MGRIKKYEEFSINEKSLSDKNIKNVNRFNKASDYIKIIKDLKNLKDYIRTNLSNIHYDDIKYSKKDYDNIDIYFNKEIKKKLINYYDISSECEDDDNYDKLSYNMEIGDIDNKLPNISLEGSLNNFDIMNGIPSFLRGIGLGKKIYKKIIKDFKYIKSSGAYDPSIESSMVFKSLAKDKEIYTFIYRDDILCIWNTYDYNKIIKLLKIYYNNLDSYDINKTFFDDDFLKKYKLKDSDLFDIIMKK